MLNGRQEGKDCEGKENVLRKLPVSSPAVYVDLYWLITGWVEKQDLILKLALGFLGGGGK